MKRYPKPEILERIPLDRDAVIEASAGTGKTFTLEHLIVEIMLNGRDGGGRVPIEKILIVTYTERATIELRERVRALLERILSHVDAPADGPVWELDEADQKWIERQLFAFEKAPIHTIHGFCRRVLSENAFHMRKLFDQTHVDAQVIFDRAFKRALRERLARETHLQPYLVAWLQFDDVEKLSSDLSQVLRTTAIVRPKWNENDFKAAAKMIASVPIDWDAWIDGYNAHVMASPEDADRRAGRIMRAINACRRFQTFGDLSELLVDLNPDIEDFQREAEEYSHEFGAFVRTLASVRVATLQTFMEPVREVLDEEKARGFFDFDDMLRLVWERLADTRDPNARHLVGMLRDQYRFALVDEFQDTDEVQWNIFRRVFFESPNNRLYVIGDPKQAIYSFRGADVITYINARSAIEQAGIETINLTQNFRSTPELIEAYNKIFDQKEEHPFFQGKITYDHPVTAGQKERKALDGVGSSVIPIQLVRIHADRKKVLAYQIRDTYGPYIASEIRKILGAPWCVVEADGTSRPIEARDIFILTRTRNEERQIGEYLRRERIPFSFYKLEGLYQTPEAYEVLDLLRAIDEPHVEEHRFRAWGTAFFGIELRDLAACRDLPETDALVDRLIRWHEIAQARDFERLFTDILDSSGIIRREIFFKDSERELTNYLHIIEQLVEETHASNLDMRELVQRLQKWVTKSDAPEGEDKNIQRLESEKAAVQVMTMHKSKGLEADVVFLFGGLWNGWMDFVDMHIHDKRIKHIGPPMHPMAIDAARQETRDENSRLLYVAVTRARARVYLPYFDKRDCNELSGTYSVLNDRLQHMRGNLEAGLFEVREISPDTSEAPSTGGRSVGVHYEISERAGTTTEVSRSYQSLRGTPLVVSSYSRMKQAKGGYRTAVDMEEFKTEKSEQPDAWRQNVELPGGTGPGVFMHALLEDSRFSSAADITFEEWCSLPEIDQIFDDNHRKFAIDTLYKPHALYLVYQTLTTPMALPDTVSRVADLSRERREVEFVFPIPETSHPSLKEGLPDGSFTIERGWIKGFIDLLFEVDGKVYFADWKTDTLPSYDASTLETHVALNYDLQARLYSLAVARLYGLRDRESFDQRFGGYVYFFLRGIHGDGRGVFARCPTYDDVCSFEEDLQVTQF
jgi:exodeoxyribonuclease V beta subunit